MDASDDVLLYIRDKKRRYLKIYVVSVRDLQRYFTRIDELEYKLNREQFSGPSTNWLAYMESRELDRPFSDVRSGPVHLDIKGVYRLKLI